MDNYSKETKSAHRFKLGIASFCYYYFLLNNIIDRKQTHTLYHTVKIRTDMKLRNNFVGFHLINPGNEGFL